jgi:hypothetical protein
MSRTKNAKATTTATRAWQRARETAEHAKPAAAQVKPLADSTRAAASRGLRRVRAWAAPQVERTGHVLEDTVAPKVSALLSRSARRLEPGKPAGQRWRKATAVVISVAMAAAGAVTAALRSRKAHDSATEPATDRAEDVTPITDADSKKPARTS